MPNDIYPLARPAVERWRWDKFKVGDRVTWADDEYATMTGGRKRFGDGPFTVTEIKNVPYSPVDAPYTLALAPPEISRWAAMGHTQIITVSPAGIYSGAFFRRLEDGMP